MKITPILLCTLWLLAGGTAFAQQTTGALEGRVLDPQRAIVRAAIVTARNTQTGFERVGATDGDGVYRLPALPVGTYDVVVRAIGFADAGRSALPVTIAETQRVDFTLSLQPIVQTVDVRALSPVLDTTNAGVGQVVDPLRVRSLPLNGRQFANLAATIPGVGLGFHSDPTKGANYAPQINGGAGRNINYLVDGGDNNDDTVGGLLQQFPLEGIEEFNFQTARFKAEYGRSNGGVMNVITKSGTNQYQTTLFELFRDRSMNALTETEKLAVLGSNTSPDKGNYRRNQFGGSIGGPIVQDRLHFFVALERTAQDTTQTVNTKGIFPSLDGAFPTLYRENLGTAKLTAVLTPSQFAAIRYGDNNNSFPFNASPTTTPDDWADAANRFHSVNVNHNWVLGGTRLNEFVFQYAYYHDRIAARTSASNVAFSNGVTTGASLTAPQWTEQVKFQLRDDFSWRKTGGWGLGHDFKLGVSFVDEPRLAIASTAGSGVVSYTVNGNSLTSPVVAVTEAGGSGSANIPTKQYGFYLQDDWRVSDRLTLNLGVRYDLVTGLAFDQSKNPNFVAVQTAARAGRLAGIAGLENFGLDPQSDRNNIQPRLGAIYNVKGEGRDVIRGGWGIYTDFGYTNSNVLVAALDASGGRFGTIFSASNPAGLKNPDGTPFTVGESPSIIAAQNVASASLPLLGSWVDPRLQQPYQIQSNAGWSHQLSDRTSIAVDYVNALGRDLNYKPRVNQIDPTTQLRRLSELLSPNVLSPNNSSDRPALSQGISQYNGLTISARRRMSKGIDVSASYTLARALSTIGAASDELNTANIQDPNNPFNPAVQMGPDLTTDARHRVTISAVVALPYGLQVAPFFTYRSALPIFIVDGHDLNKDGDAFDLPALAYAVDGTDAATGKSTLKSTGSCTVVNCARGWAQSQMNVRVSKMFRTGRANIEGIAEVFNLFNALNPSNIVAGVSSNRAYYLASGAMNPSFMQPASYSGDTLRPEQRAGQIGLRVSF